MEGPQWISSHVAQLQRRPVSSSPAAFPIIQQIWGNSPSIYSPFSPFLKDCLGWLFDRHFIQNQQLQPCFTFIHAQDNDGKLHVSAPPNLKVIKIIPIVFNIIENLNWKKYDSFSTIILESMVITIYVFKIFYNQKLETEGTNKRRKMSLL